MSLRWGGFYMQSRKTNQENAWPLLVMCLHCYIKDCSCCSWRRLVEKCISEVLNDMNCYQTLRVRLFAVSNIYAQPAGHGEVGFTQRLKHLKRRTEPAEARTQEDNIFRRSFAFC